MSSVCHGPEVRRLLPAPCQNGVPGGQGGTVEPGAECSLETCSSHAKLERAVHLGRPVAEPEAVSTPECWLIFAKPRNTQALGATCSRRKLMLVPSPKCAAYVHQGLY